LTFTPPFEIATDTVTRLVNVKHVAARWQDAMQPS